MFTGSPFVEASFNAMPIPISKDAVEDQHTLLSKLNFGVIKKCPGVLSRLQPTLRSNSVKVSLMALTREAYNNAES